MRRAAASLSILAVLLAATAVAAQDNVIKRRQQVMKAIDEQFEAGTGMVRGKVSYDSAKAVAIFAALSDKFAGFAELFPPGSDVGDTKAKPAIWSDRAGFDAASAGFRKALADNAPAAGTEDGFKAGFTAVANACRACHQSYKNR